jgi:phenylalanyl-tRNA synthetase beta chain
MKFRMVLKFLFLYRADVTREIDVIEEILRIYGYNKIDAPQKISFTPVKLSANDQDELENNWARTLQSWFQ